MSLLQYLQSFIWDKEETEIQVDEKSKRLKYLTCEILKNSKIKLKPTKKPTGVKLVIIKQLPKKTTTHLHNIV